VRRRAASDLSLRTTPASTVSVSFVFITRILIGEHVFVKAMERGTGSEKETKRLRGGVRRSKSG
jgi:hypothetical protein